MRKEWTLSNIQVDIILKTWLEFSQDILSDLKSIVDSLIPNDGKDILEDEHIPCNEEFQSCTIVNFHTWFSIIVASLAHHVHIKVYIIL